MTGRTHPITVSASPWSGADFRSFHHLRSIKMYSMHEALARDRMRENEQRSRQARLARELAAARRWHRVSLHARAAETRHTRRARRASVS